MEITLELVERLREKAGVSYGQAKEALEYSGGNLLDALIYLEERGVIPKPQGSYYSTRIPTPPPPPAPPPSGLSRKEQKAYRKEEKARVKAQRQQERGSFFRRVRGWLIDNELEVWRKGEPITGVPVLIVVILVVFAYWAVLPLLLAGLFFGFRYRFSGPDLERESINHVMDSVADTAEEMRRQVVDELHRQQEKNKKK